MTNNNNSNTTKKKKKFTEKRKKRLVDMVTNSPAGSLLIQQEREEDEKRSIPRSDKVDTILADLKQKVVRLYQQHLDYEIDKKRLILGTANELADALRENGQEDFISKVCYTMCRALKPIKGFASDRYIQKILPAEYKDIEQRQRAISGRTSSAKENANTEQKFQEMEKLIAEKRALNESEKGITDYTIEDLDRIEEPVILRQIAIYHMQRVQWLEGELKRLKNRRKS